MQWTAEPGAGFSTTTPWIDVNPNSSWLNAAAQYDDPSSVYNFYRALISLRHSEPVIVDGEFVLLPAEPEQVYAFRRQLADRCIDLYANLSDSPVRLPDEDTTLAGILLGNYPPELQQAGTLKPWEVRIYGR
jgi:oligo-1,6-glucosidase